MPTGSAAGRGARDRWRIVVLHCHPAKRRQVGQAPRLEQAKAGRQRQLQILVLRALGLRKARPRRQRQEAKTKERDP